MSRGLPPSDMRAHLDGVAGSPQRGSRRRALRRGHHQGIHGPRRRRKRFGHGGEGGSGCVVISGGRWGLVLVLYTKEHDSYQEGHVPRAGTRNRGNLGRLLERLVICWCTHIALLMPALLLCLTAACP